MITPFVDFINFSDTIGVEDVDKITITAEGMAGEAKMEIQKRDLVELVDLAQEAKRHRDHS